ncbi:MAG: hypothetical protein V4487_00365 [Chlamydiota bacterium]
MFIFLILKLTSGYSEEVKLSSPPSELPVSVNISLYLWNLLDFSEKNENFRAEFYLESTWKDSRLAFQGKDEFLTFTDDGAVKKLEEIWWPAFDFINGIDLSYTNRILTIHPDGTVEYSIKVLGTFFTKMNLRKFPFDEQFLLIKIESSFWDSNILQFKATPEEMGAINIEDFDGLHLVGISAIVKDVTFSFTKHAFSDFTSIIQIKRSPSFFIYQTIIPLMIVFIITCCTFFLDVAELISRLTLLQGCVLIAVATKFSVNNSLPEVDYFTGVDYIFFLFYLCCLIASFMSVVNYHLWKKKNPLGKSINEKAFWIFFILFITLLVIFFFLMKR